jgi:hypothetical protein
MKLYFKNYANKLAILSLILTTATPYCYASSPTKIIDIAKPIIQELRHDILPYAINGLRRHATLSNRLYTAMYFLGLRKPIQQDLAIKKLRKTNQLEPISSCTDSNALLLRPMVQQIGLNPQHVFIIETNATEMLGSPMAAYTSSYGQIIAIDSQILARLMDYSHSPFCSMINQQRSDELRFLLGHELSHAVHKHDLKRILIYFALPWITHLGLKIIHGAAQVCLDALAKKLGADKLPLINVARSLTHFLCKHPLMELLITKRLASSCMRRQEKQADLDSARQFNCAQAGVNFMRRIQSRQNRFAEILKLFIGTHPSEQERINYLTPLAIAQAQ